MEYTDIEEVEKQLEDEIDQLNEQVMLVTQQLRDVVEAFYHLRMMEVNFKISVVFAIGVTPQVQGMLFKLMHIINEAGRMSDVDGSKPRPTFEEFCAYYCPMLLDNYWDSEDETDEEDYEEDYDDEMIR